MKTPDIGLSFALWLNQVRNSFFKELILNKSNLRHVSIWDIGESGGFFHHYDSQHEKYSYTDHEYPASRNRRIEYFPEGDLPLHRPEANNFINSSQQYPLLGTSQIKTCFICRGSGRIPCRSCGGRGRSTSINSKGKFKRDTCLRCRGTGNVRCERCSGEGKLLTYTSKDYIWKHTTDREPIILPIIDRPNVRSLITTTHSKGGSYPVDEFTQEEIIKKIGVYNERIGALVRHANDQAIRKEEEIKQRFGTLLFQEHSCFYIPLGFVNLFVNHKFRQFFVAGNLTYRRTLSPPVGWNLFKLLGWFAIGVALSLYSSVLMKRELAIIAILISLGVLQFILDFLLQWPRTWLIFDDDGLGGWLFVHLLVQSISLSRKGKLLDPCYTELFHLPQIDTYKSRNSFFCTIETGKGKQRQNTELFLVSQRALSLFNQDLQKITQRIQTLVWVIQQLDAAQTDGLIADFLKVQSPEIRKRIHLILVTDKPVFISSVTELSQTHQYLNPQQISLYSLSLLQAFQELQDGQQGPETETTLKMLLEVVELPQKEMHSNSGKGSEY